MEQDYFSIFGLKPGFDVDLFDLQTKYFGLCKVLHPDRRGSTERMSILNTAYQTLKDPSARRSYVLNLLNAEEGPSEIPLELSEEWFEIQDSQDPKKMSEFALVLTKATQDCESEISLLEKAYTTTPQKEHLKRLRSQVKTQQYLRSLKKDFDRIQL